MEADKLQTPQVITFYGDSIDDVTEQANSYLLIGNYDKVVGMSTSYGTAEMYIDPLEGKLSIFTLTLMVASKQLEEL